MDTLDRFLKEKVTELESKSALESDFNMEVGNDTNSYNIRLLLKLDGLLTSWGNATSEAAYLDKACKEAKQVNG